MVMGYRVVNDADRIQSGNRSPLAN